MIQGLHHIVLFCSDTERSKAWYEKAGFHFSHGYDGMYWFALGSEQMMLHPSRDVQPSGVAVHVAVDDARAHFAAVTAQGLTPFDHQNHTPLTAPVTRPWGDVEFDLADPDGHRWSFTERR